MIYYVGDFVKRKLNSFVQGELEKKGCKYKGRRNSCCYCKRTHKVEYRWSCWRYRALAFEGASYEEAAIPGERSGLLVLIATSAPIVAS
jgi:hypothetical protein